MSIPTRANFRARQTERGFVLVLLAFSAFVLVLLAGFGVDLGSWYLTGAKLQRASDAAALAGASALPDQAAAASAVTDAFTHNGLASGGSISISQNIAATSVTATVTDNAVPTYFLRIFMGSISMSRTSRASFGSQAPTLGSPFNFLGTGDMSIPGVPTKQNFWLAINGVCVPAEDGDLLDSEWDANKIDVDPITGAALTANAHHECGGGGIPKNKQYDNGGYAYYVDVPSVPSGGSVDIKIYNGSYNEEPGTPDRNLALVHDLTGQGVDMGIIVSDTADTPADPKDDTVLVQAMETAEDGTRPGAENGWMTLTTVHKAGLYRLQVWPDYNTFWPEGELGIHSFSLLAQRSWGAYMGCDRRLDPTCPRIYAQGSESVYNSVPSSGAVDYYFAQIPAAFAGSTINAYLWDPGEGVDQIQFVGPAGSLLHFDWTASPVCPTNVSGTDVTALPSSGTCVAPTSGLSNVNMFNDRLVAAVVHLPANYASMVAGAGGDDYIRVRYLVNGAPNDRTTWGVTLPSGTNGVTHLVNPGP